MKIKVEKLPKTMSDEKGNLYNTKDLAPTGRMVDWHKNFTGWQYRIGNRLLRVTK